MADLDGQKALAYGVAHPNNVQNQCLGQVYADYGSVPSIGPHAGQYPIAYNGWLYSPHQVSDNGGPINGGYPVWFGISPTRTDRNKAAGDVGLAANNRIGWFTDANGAGHSGYMTFEARAKQTSRPFLGHTTDFLGHPVVNVGALPPLAPAGSGSVSNPTVAALQTALNKFGYGLVVDGRYGPKTRAALGAFQSNHGLKVDYQAGPLTWAKLNAPAQPAPTFTGTLRKGSRGPAVAKLQQTLNAKYPAYSHLKVDSDYGNATAGVVSELQRRARLHVDGIAGYQTLHYLGLA